MTDGWVSLEDLQKERLKADPKFQAAFVGLNGVPSPQRNPLQAYRYIVERRNTIIRANKQRPLIRLWDASMNYIGRITGEISADWEELLYSAGAAQVTIARSNWLADFLMKDVRAEDDLHITIDPRPTKRSWRTRWGGKVVEAHIKRTSDGIHQIELHLIHNWEHWKHINLRANPVLPPEVQWPKIYMAAMNTRSAVCYTATLNLMRQYVPLLSIPTNLFNPFAWLIPVIDPAIPTANKKTMFNFNPLDWPVQMEYINPILDQSRFGFLVSRWAMADVATEPMLRDAGCFMWPVTFIAGEDTESPHEELADIIGQANAMPTRNSVVFKCPNKSGVTGPTGTLIDGVLNLFGATADDMLTEFIFPVDQDLDGITDPLFRKWLGVAPAKPKVIFRDGEYSGIIESDRIQRRHSARTIVTGGKSPGWLNQAQTFMIRYGLAQLSAVISYGLGAYQQYGTPGLDNLYQGQLDDTLFAFEAWTDPKRVFSMGSHAFLEHKEDGSGTAWTVSGLVTIRQGLDKTKSKTTATVSIINGYPWIVYEDFELGDRVMFELADILFTDQVGGIKWSYSADQPKKCDLTIGTGQEPDPFGRALRAIQGVWGVVGMILGDGGSTF
jgi:hypothetical protein